MIDERALYRLASTLRDGGYNFVSPTPATHARVNGRAGNEWARNVTDVFGWSRPFRDGVLAMPLVDLMRTAGVLVPSGEGWRSLIRVSSLGGMLFVHSAYPTLAADAVFFGPDTYRFASAIDAWFDRGHRAVARAVDIGCGAGPGAVVIARARPAASVVAGDINQAALAFTRVNAILAGCSNVIAGHSDLLTGIDGDFDLIVSNPPYLIDPAARAYRHGGGDLGAGLSLAIVTAALPRLAIGGTLLLYTGAAIVNGHDALRSAAAERCRAVDATWTYRELDPDVFGEELDHGPYRVADRVAAVLLTVQRNG